MLGLPQAELSLGTEQRPLFDAYLALLRTYAYLYRRSDAKFKLDRLSIL